MADTGIPPKLNLLNLPPETLDEIATNIPSPSSLLSLSKSSKELAAVILPHHLPFRVIRAPLLRADLWEYLTRDEYHAANVRSLTITQDELEILSPDEYAVTEWLPPLPEGTKEADGKSVRDIAADHVALESECEIALASALRCMVRLHRFAWYRLSSPVLNGENDVWSVLQSLGIVRELDILDKPSGTNPNADGTKNGIIFSDTFLRLSGFTSLKLHTSALDDLGDEPELTLLINMLRLNCPDLESLSLSLQLYRHISPAPISSLLSQVTWPHLRIVRLKKGLGCSVASLARFLRTHPGIEDLALGRMLPGRSWEKFGQGLYRDEGEGENKVEILPRLRSLECSSAQAAAILIYPKATLEKLEGIEVHDTVVLDDYFDWDDEWEDEHADESDGPGEDTTALIPSPWKTQFLERLEACSSITSLGVTHKGDIKQLNILAKVAPQLTVLDVKADYADESSKVVSDASSSIASPSLSRPLQREWCAFYALFPSLHTVSALHLFSIGPTYLLHNMKQNNEHMNMLASACPKLQVIDDGYRKAIIIREVGEDKGGGNVRWVVRDKKGSEEGNAEDGEVVYGS